MENEQYFKEEGQSSIDDFSRFKESVDTIIFRDEYVVIVTTKKTYTLKYKDMGDISMGWLDNIQSNAISAAKYPNQKRKHFITDK